MVLPVDGAVVTLEAAVLDAAVVAGLVETVLGLDVEDAGRAAKGPFATLVVFGIAPLSGLAVVEVLGFGPVDATGLLELAVLLGLATLEVSAAVLLVVLPFTAGRLVQFVAVAVARDVVLAGPTGLLSTTLVWVFTVGETAATPTSLLGTTPAADAAFAAGAATVFFAEVVFEELLFEDWTLLIERFEAGPG